jgi:hypothetical protein
MFVENSTFDFPFLFGVLLPHRSRPDAPPFPSHLGAARQPPKKKGEKYKANPGPPARQPF